MCADDSNMKGNGPDSTIGSGRHVVLKGRQRGVSILESLVREVRCEKKNCQISFSCQVDILSLVLFLTRFCAGSCTHYRLHLEQDPQES